MASATESGSDRSIAPRWSERVVYFALGDPVRRRIFLRLAHGKPLPASLLKNSVDRTLDATYKQLIRLRAAGLVMKKDDPSDDRRSLWELVAGIPIKTTPVGKIIDFGFIRVPLK